MAPVLAIIGVVASLVDPDERSIERSAQDAGAHGIEATGAQLMEESTKARENGERYTEMPAGNAAAVARRERSRV